MNIYNAKQNHSVYKCVILSSNSQSTYNSAEYIEVYHMRICIAIYNYIHIYGMHNNVHGFLVRALISFHFFFFVVRGYTFEITFSTLKAAYCIGLSSFVKRSESTKTI